MIGRIAYRLGDAMFPEAANRFWRSRVRGTVRCYLYHRVGEPGEFPFLDAHGAPVITSLQLRNDIEFLRRQGARFMTFRDLRQGDFPSRREFGAIISFDDGTKDVYERGLPVLEELGVSGVVFQIASLVDSSDLLWEHVLYRIWDDERLRGLFLDELRARNACSNPISGEARELESLRMIGSEAALQSALQVVLDAGQIPDASDLAIRLNPTVSHLRRAVSRGHEIGSHGYGHYMRKSLDDGAFSNELLTSRQTLESIIGQPVSAYSHPFNSYLEGESDVLKEHFEQVSRVDGAPILHDSDQHALTRFNWPGHFRNRLRWRRWLWTGG